MSDNKELVAKEVRLTGLPLSGGCAVGRVCMFNENRHSNLPMYRVNGTGIERETNRVKRAIEIAAERLKKVQIDVAREIGPAEAEIFVAQKMILEDATLMREVSEQIGEHGLNAESAIAHVLNSYEEKLRALDDEYIKERATDFGEIKRRLLDVLGNMNPGLQCNEGNCHKGRDRVIVAEELTPSLTIDVDPNNTIAFVTEHGGTNSHAAILARALQIPAVSGLTGLRRQVGCGTELLIDGDRGEVVIWPTEETVATALAATKKTRGMPDPVDPVDGFKVMANISFMSDVEECLRMKAEGIGLYRTEFELIAAGRYFSEDELYERYVAVAKAMAGTMVLYRLFDIGSDKTLPFMQIPDEENPSLGWRGARLLLGKTDLLRTQARALARTSAGGRIHVMYPMIVDLDQFLQIKNVFMEAVEDIPHGIIRHGIMFEVPSACLQAAELFKHVDFASIGSNDLTQYLFAVDRDNELVSYDYNPDRRVFWDLMRTIADAAQAEDKPLSLCGELAGFPRFVKKLVKLGLTSVSVSPRRIPGVRKAAAEALAGLAPQ